MSTATSSATRRSSHCLRRAAAALAAAAAGLHAASLGEHAPSPMVGIVTIAMIFGCLYCARHLWMRGSPRDWGLVATMNIGMVALHLTIMSRGSGGTNHHGHMTHAVSAPMDHSMSTLMAAALATAALEAVIAVTVLFYQTRLDDREILP
ncbi:hypothetical protein [Rhodococcus pyridinivorans]|uniref:hypothetical protein n=1 Tax=Rhodococcus pyridinivorans TaxID=103816 RepID=UPI0020784FF4|nr:hypothetical protein [Rhodococcus pyridinivorans]USI92978.1 hypothetical protein LLA01_24890 [Rhodococcus pyridinivorans]